MSIPEPPHRVTSAGTGSSASPHGAPAPIKAVPVRHPGRWVAAVFIGVLVAMFINSVISNEKWGWDYIFEKMFSGPVMSGLITTLWLTVLSMFIGVVLGIILAIMRLSPNPVLSYTAWLYIWVFRGTPILVQLVMWGNIGALYKSISLGIPFGEAFFTFDTRTLIPNVMAAILGLSLNEAAYMAEIIRGGIQSVDRGQTEAASALGMSRSQTLRRIVMPQAMRVIIPPTGNETISMLKTTSLVAYVPYYELFFQAQVIGVRDFRPFPMLVMASIWYLFLTSILMVGQYYIEKHYSKGFAQLVDKKKSKGRLERPHRDRTEVKSDAQQGTSGHSGAGT